MARVLPLAPEPVVRPQLRVRLLQVCISTPRRRFALQYCAQKVYYSVADGYDIQALNRPPVVCSTSPSPKDPSV